MDHSALILVTGANCFVGNALCHRELAKGLQVRRAVRSRSNSANMPIKVEPIVVGEVGPDTDWSNALNGVDTVIHLAAPII